jgi:hypothetical protein
LKLQNHPAVLPAEEFNFKFPLALCTGNQQLTTRGKIPVIIKEEFNPNQAGQPLSLGNAGDGKKRLFVADETLLQNFEREPFFKLHTGGTQDRSDRPSRPALFSDDFPKVILCHPQLENRCLLAFDCANCHLIRIVHKSFRDLLDEFLHSDLPKLACALSKNSSYE